MNMYIIYCIIFFILYIWYFYNKEYYNSYNITKNSNIKYNEVKNIENYLQKYKNNKKNIIYIPNIGNAGDSLIAYATFLIFNKLKLKYTIGNLQKKYKNSILIYAGGGNLIGLYNQCYNFLINNLKNNKIIILPHSIINIDKLFKLNTSNIIFFCREKYSYNYVYSKNKYKNNIFLSKDMAFYIKNINIKTSNKYKFINCFREDVEKTNLTIPDENYDLSIIFSKYPKNNNFNQVMKTSFKIFEKLKDYEIIKTNRLHLCIAGFLLNKQVECYSNNYFKIKGIYEYSLKHNSNIKFYKNINPFIFYVSCEKNKNKWKYIRNLGIKNYLIICGSTKIKNFYKIEKDVLLLNCNDDYDGLPEKIIMMLNVFINDKYFDKYTHIIKMNDYNKLANNFFKILNKIEMIKMLNNNDYCGYNLISKSDINEKLKTLHFKYMKDVKKHGNKYWFNKKYDGIYRNFLKDSSGYFLSRNAIIKILNTWKINNINKLRKMHIYEDVMISNTLYKYKIYPKLITFESIFI